MKAPAAALTAFLTATGLFAHDFWIEPSNFRPPLGAPVRVTLRVGQNFRGDPVPRDNRRIERFVLVGPSGETSIPGLDGVDPAGLTRASQPGLYVIGYRSGRTPIELEADKFEKYLQDEGLEKVVKERAHRGETARPGREVFSRCAKAILVSGDGPASGFDRPLGLTLELLPEKNPVKTGELPVTLLYQGKPLEGALVVAMNRDEPDKRVTARTNAKGRVSLALSRPGVWLIKAVHMIPAPADAGADWESLWASLTFEIAD